MFRALFRQAQVTMEASIHQVVERIWIAVPFVIAAGFAAASLTIRLVHDYGAERASLAMALLFAVLGLIVAAILSRPRAPVDPEAVVAEEMAREQAKGEAPREASTAGLSVSESELLMAALASALPMAVPHIMRALLRNLPLIAAVATAAFVVSRPSNADHGSAPFNGTRGMEPAE